MSDQEEVGFIISGKDLTADAIESAKKNLASLSGDATGHSEKTSKALMGISFAARGIAQELGVGAPIARFFGSEMMNMAGTLGGAASGLAIVALAAMATYKIYEHFTAVATALREEHIKAGNTMADEVLAMETNRVKTAELRQEKYNLYVEMHRIAERDLEIAIAAQTDKIKEQAKALNTASAAAKFLAEDIYLLNSPEKSYGAGPLSSKWAEDTTLALAKPRSELEKMVIELAKMRMKEDELKGGAEGKSQFEYGASMTPYAFGQMQEWMLMERAKVERQKSLTDEGTYLSERAKLYKAYGSTAEETYQADLAAFDAETAAKMNAMKTEDEKKDYYLKRNMERMSMEATHQQNTEKLKQAAMLASAQYFSQALDTMASLGGTHARRYFEMHKVAATAEAIISTYQGAAKALGQGGAYGYVLAAAVIAAGLANVAKIQAQTFDGGAGAGGGGGYNAGGYSTTQSTASGGDYKYFNYEQSQYGSGWRPGSGPSGPTINVYGDVYAQDGDAFQKKVAGAWNASVRTGEYGVNDTAKRYQSR